MKSTVSTTLLFACASAHIAAYAKGTFCLFGNSTRPDKNSNIAAQPLIDLKKKDWFMSAISNCDEPNDFLELPAGGSFTVEMAGNVAHTSFGSKGNGKFGNGKDTVEKNEKGCINNPNLHTRNEAEATGSSFAISYAKDFKSVSMENLVVFTVRKNTPFYRVASFDVPRDMPACPPNGCYCSWNWLPGGCGKVNLYMQPFRCKVTNVRSTARELASPKVPVRCDQDKSKCVKGAKGLIIAYQKEGNNAEKTRDFAPAYNTLMGFQDGAQNDIFVENSRVSPQCSQ
jgi:hypothetical protein